MTRTLFVIAGEPSGDRLGAALMSGLKALEPGIVFHGIGGPLMEAEGLQTLFPMEELSVMGLGEILPRLPGLLRRVSQTAEEVARLKPDALVTVDIPEFALRVAAKVKARAPQIRTIHYVAPTVWAWRSGRAAKMAHHIDHVLALFPFEPPFMEAAGMTCDFVGHPVATEPQASPEDARAFRDRHGIAPADPLLLVLPGSRRGEVSRLAPVFGGALELLRAQQPDLRVVIPTLASVAPVLADLTRDWPVAPVILDPGAMAGEAYVDAKRAAFKAADLALAASGTVSLELAASATPMVIAYDMNWLSKQMIRRLLQVDTVTLVNLVSETREVPEFLAENCRSEPIAAALATLLHDRAARERQIAVARSVMEALGRGKEAPGLRAARSVLGAI